MAKQNTYRKLSEYPDVVEAKERHAELTAMGAEAEVRLRDLEVLAGPEDDTSEVSRLAADMVAGSAAVAIARPDVKAELAAARVQAAATGEAIELQRKGVDAAIVVAREVMIEERRAGHLATVLKINEAVTLLEKTLADERAFLSDLKADGGRAEGLVRIKFPFNLGVLRTDGTYQLLRDWRDVLKRHGILKGDR